MTVANSTTPTISDHLDVSPAHTHPRNSFYLPDISEDAEVEGDKPTRPPPAPSPPTSSAPSFSGFSELGGVNDDRQAHPLDEESQSYNTAGMRPTIKTLCALSYMGILGTAARMGLEQLFDIPHSPLPPILYAQFLGSFVYGIFQTTSAVPKNAPLHSAITAGFCGCCTSFSSFMLGMFAEISYSKMVFPGGLRLGGGQGVLGLVGYTLGTLCLSFSGLHLGQHVGQHGPWKIPGKALEVVDKAGYLLGAAAILAPLFIVIFLGDSRDTYWVFALLFTLPGVHLRYGTSKLLNPLRKNYYWGTFAVNVLGSAVLAACVIGQLRFNQRSEELWKRSILAGVAEGFCGSLTTVSTFVGEVNTLRGLRAVNYTISSIVAGFLIVMVILGGYVWSR